MTEIVEEVKDWSDKEIEALSKQEKHQLFVSTFKYKPDWLSSKVVLMQSKLSREELNLLSANPDEDLTDFYFKNE